MRLYFTAEETALLGGGAPHIVVRPAVGGVPIAGSFSHLRGGYLLNLPDDAPHGELLDAPGVVHVPLEDVDGRPLGLDHLAGDVPVDKRDAIATLLELRGLPVDPFTAGHTVEQILLHYHRRIVARQMLVDAGLPDLGSLDTADAPGIRRAREALRARGLPMDGVPETTPRAALNALLPAIRSVRVRPKAQAPSGTFTDDFSGEASDVDLAAHTPSGGGAWTRVRGTAGSWSVNATTGVGKINTGFFGNLAYYLCDDQGSADCYVQAQTKTTTSLFTFLGQRMAGDPATFIGIRCWNGTGKLDIYKVVGGGTTLLGTSAAAAIIGDTIRMESSGDSHEGFINGLSKLGPVTESTNNTITRQGLFTDGPFNLDVIDDFEAGVLAAGGASALLAIAQAHHDTGGGL